MVQFCSFRDALDRVTSLNTAHLVSLVQWEHTGEQETIGILNLQGGYCDCCGCGKRNNLSILKVIDLVSGDDHTEVVRRMAEAIQQEFQPGDED